MNRYDLRVVLMLLFALLALGEGLKGCGIIHKEKNLPAPVETVQQVPDSVQP